MELTGVSKHFEDTISLSSIDLSVREGEILGILGSSGCGKTTLLKLILGLLTPSKGDIIVNGESIVRIPPEDRNFGYIPQTLALFSHLSVCQNIVFGLKARKFKDSIISERLSKILDLLGIEHLQSKFPHEISGGERQRVALGRALALEPTLILMDEPLSSLDTKLSQQLRWQIKAILKKTKITAIFVTHNPGEAISICDRIAIMDQGHIIQVGLPSELINSPTDIRVVQILGKTNIFKVKTELKIKEGKKGFNTSIGSFKPINGTKSNDIKACWISEYDISLKPFSEDNTRQIEATLLGTEWGRVTNKLIFEIQESVHIVAQVPIENTDIPNGFDGWQGNSRATRDLVKDSKPFRATIKNANWLSKGDSTYRRTDDKTSHHENRLD